MHLCSKDTEGCCIKIQIPVIILRKEKKNNKEKSMEEDCLCRWLDPDGRVWADYRAIPSRFCQKAGSYFCAGEKGGTEEAAQHNSELCAAVVSGIDSHELPPAVLVI